MTSLRRRLFLLLISATATIWLCAVGWIYFASRADLEHVLDTRLQEAARMVHSMVASSDLETGGATAASVADFTYNRQLSCQVWSLSGLLLARSGGAPEGNLAEEMEGFSDRRVNGEMWRVYTVVDSLHGAFRFGQAAGIAFPVVRDSCGVFGRCLSHRDTAHVVNQSGDKCAALAQFHARRQYPCADSHGDAMPSELDEIESRSLDLAEGLEDRYPGCQIPYLAPAEYGDGVDDAIDPARQTVERRVGDPQEADDDGLIARNDLGERCRADFVGVDDTKQIQDDLRGGRKRPDFPGKYVQVERRQRVFRHRYFSR